MSEKRHRLEKLEAWLSKTAPEYVNGLKVFRCESCPDWHVALNVVWQGTVSDMQCVHHGEESAAAQFWRDLQGGD